MATWVACIVDTKGRQLSRRLSTMALGFVVQTNVDRHSMYAYSSGECVRRLDYLREGDGWITVEGTQQPWEHAYFFEDGDEGDEGFWPLMLDDDISDEDRARYEEARRAGDPSSVLALLRPSSTDAMWRVCESLGIAKRQAASGTWKKPSFLSRLFGSS
jgi:hypothetical protein